jgi:hypothetical protein
MSTVSDFIVCSARKGVAIVRKSMMYATASANGVMKNSPGAAHNREFSEVKHDGSLPVIDDANRVGKAESHN